MPKTVDLIIDTYLGNPFETSDADRDALEAALRQTSIAGSIDRLLQKGQVDRAKQLALAIGHRQAIATPTSPSKVLDSKVFPSHLAKRLPRQRADYLRIVMAAGRCHAALSKLSGSSGPIHELRRKIWAACFGHSLRHALDLERVIRDHDVLILGETGTGKELIAHAILEATPGSARGEGAPRASLNAAAIPDTLVESELFGHIKGAFTGATETRTGRIRSASGGCLFLDEVGDLPLTTQVKLLRVIETNRVHPLGSDKSHEVDVRYVAATHKDLDDMVERRVFRQDLYERLAGNVIEVPPLRDRPEDIAAIGRAFLETYLVDGIASQHADRIQRWVSGAEAKRYSWPGNVRELQNALRNLLMGLPPGLRADTLHDAASSDETPLAIREGNATMRQVEDWYLSKVLTSCEGNLARTARNLEMDRSTVRRRVDKLRAK